MSTADRAARAVLRATGVASRHVTTDVARHHVYDARGRGPLPPIVLLPGLSDTGASHAPLIWRLRPRVRRVVVVESAGHGLSGPARVPYTIERHLSSVAAALDQILDEPAVLVGNSLGGATALHYAATRPARVAGLYLTSPAGAALDDATVADLRRAFTIRTVADARTFLDRVLARPTPLAPVLARVLRARAGAPAIADLLADLGNHPGVPAADLGKLAVPVTVMWGRAERLLAPSALAFFRAHLPPHAVVVEPPGIGHCPHLDAPGRLAHLIAAFAGDRI